VDLARSSGYVGAHRVSSLGQLEANVAAISRLDFEADELVEIDRHARDGAINIWARSSES
jgi:L-glyceraldehyde 3-phosphate reductase